ncbi:hypothetical protein [Paenibacillus lactis]|uniref:Lipoprotein n=1 Tax=Paenibacillus lactis TaxID=228574 RepID=A0ABS4F9X3_9BACL|nr:hypothetical protein [Paenibacillus lactis]MBP1893038.1 hypothetical protein [Paenibacillus lactis]HAF97500.1 hypothetical protein [Paenibacillus lactis]
MKKVISVIIFTVLILVGCGPSIEKQTADLNSKANDDYYKGYLKEAIISYEESLRLKEDPEISEKLSLIKAEHEAVLDVRRRFEMLDGYRITLNTSTTIEELKETIENIEQVLDYIPRISSPEGTPIYGYLSELPSNYGYTTIKYEASLLSAATNGIIIDSKKQRSAESLSSSIESFLKNNNQFPSFYKE